MDLIENFYLPKTEPFKHQRLALAAWDRPGYGWLMEMGTGKTKVCIDNICMLRERRGLRRALIVAPKGTYESWTGVGFPSHLPQRHEATSYRHLWEGGGTKRELRTIEYLCDNEEMGAMKILVMNVEAISNSEKAFRIAERFVKSGGALLGVDESSTAKNPDSTRTKRLLFLRRHSAWRRIMTGSPVTRDPLDLFSQFELLQDRCLGHSNYYAFRNKYAIMRDITVGNAFDGNERTTKLIVGFRHMEELSQYVAMNALVVRKEDCLDLPPKVRMPPRYVEMTDEQAKMYDDMKRYFSTTVLGEDKAVSAPIVIAQLIKMHQILCGHVTDENGVVQDVPTKRLDALEQMVGETSGRNIIWCSYRRDVEKVAERLRKMKRRVVTYYGATSPKDREEAVFRFQGYRMVPKGSSYERQDCPEADRADDFVSTPSTGGYGITLTEASNVIYYSNNYDLEKREQSEDRAHRIGQTKSVSYTDLMVKGTIEETIISCLQRKRDLASLIMDGPARVMRMLDGSE